MEQFSDYRPVYLQLMEECKGRILSGKWPPGQKIPSVRELSIELGANPNTVQRALGLLEQEGLLQTYRTVGRFVTGDPEVIARAKEAYGRECTGAFCRRLQLLGIDKAQLILWIQEEQE